MRLEIQGLRALAVAGVLLFHLWPLRLPGGFVGVDVFFVVSGFLITDHLAREFDERKKISLPSFWARRVRRLLPASLLVLVLTAVAVWLLVPVTRWAQLGAEIIASTLYVENWALAAQAVDYMALSNVMSPTQQFWTLSVEEQFYIAWPILLIVGWAAARRLGRNGIAGIAAVVGVITASSLLASVVVTASSPDIAYFSTFTRAWEFGAGALLALALRRFTFGLSAGLNIVIAWVGLALVAIAMVAYGPTTPFPSYTAALPVIGTLMVIAAGSPTGPLSPMTIVSSRPVQFIGGISYGVYLWHWPLIILVPFGTGHALTTIEKIAILVASLVLGAASKFFIEDPARTSRWLGRSRPRRSFLGAAAVMAVVCAVALPLAVATVPPPPEVAESPEPCVGAESMVSDSCGNPLTMELRAPAVSFPADLPSEQVRGCERSVETREYVRCDWGRAKSAAPRIALVGDSHATRWVEAFERAADSAGRGLSTYLVSGCPLVTREPLGSAWGFDPVGSQHCPVPTDGVLKEIASDPSIKDVVFVNRTRLYLSERGDYHPMTPDMVASTVTELKAAGKNVIVLAATPELNAIPVSGAASAADCLTVNSDATTCTLARDASSFSDPMRVGTEAAGGKVLDLTDLFCTEERCLPQIGGLVVYTDDNHLTRSFALSTSRILAQRLAPMLTADAPAGEE